MFGKGLTLKTKVTNGECPTCQAPTVFVSLFKNVYRCINCGTDNEQKVNGVISYMPVSSPDGKIPTLDLVKDNGTT